jgi:formylmethanofuran dehydrogenase subunit E
MGVETADDDERKDRWMADHNMKTCEICCEVLHEDEMKKVGDEFFCEECFNKGEKL